MSRALLACAVVWVLAVPAWCQVPGGTQPGTQPGMQPGGMMPGMQPGWMMPGMQPGGMMPGMQPGGMMPGGMMPGMQPGAMMPGMQPGGMMPGEMMPGMEMPPEAMAGMLGAMFGGGASSVGIAVSDKYVFVASGGTLTIFKFENEKLEKVAEAQYGAPKPPMPMPFGGGAGQPPVAPLPGQEME